MDTELPDTKTMDTEVPDIKIIDTEVHDTKTMDTEIFGAKRRFFFLLHLFTLTTNLWMEDGRKTD